MEGVLIGATATSGALFCERGRLSRVHLWVPFLASEVSRGPILNSTSLGLKATLARNFCTASSNANSIAQWFLIMLILGQVARSPASIARRIKVGVGLDSIRGKSAYEISGKMVISPEYLWLSTETALVRTLGKMPISANVCIRCSASLLARWEALLNHVGPGDIVSLDLVNSSPIAFSSLTRKGTTCGLTWDTMKWLTLNISASRVMGISLSTEPSIHRCGEGFHGTASPVLGSLARSEAAV